MAWALSQQVVTDASARHVLLVLANYCDSEGRAAFPSVARLCLDTGMSERTVQYKLAALVTAGAIRPGNQAIVAAYVGRHDRRPVGYDLLIGGVERGANAAPRETYGVQTTAERGARVAPKPSLTINKKKEEGAHEKSAIEFDFDAGVFHGIQCDQNARFVEAFPAIEVGAEILKAALWLMANPANRKSNYLRYLTNWLTRAQDRAPRSTTTGGIHVPHPTRRPTAAEQRDDWLEGMFGASRRARERPAQPVEFVDCIDAQSARRTGH